MRVQIGYSGRMNRKHAAIGSSSHPTSALQPAAPVFQELWPDRAPDSGAFCAEVGLSDGTVIRLGSCASPEQIETVLGMLAC
jgi:hypothetical protein